MRNAMIIFTLMSPVGSNLGRRHRFRVRPRSPVRHILCYGTPFLEFWPVAGSPLHFRAFFKVLPHVISGHPFGLECATQPVSSCWEVPACYVRTVILTSLQLSYCLLQSVISSKYVRERKRDIILRVGPDVISLSQNRFQSQVSTLALRF